MSTDRDQSSSLHREHGPEVRSMKEIREDRGHELLRDDLGSAGRSTRGPTETGIARGGRRQWPFSDGPSDTERELQRLRSKMDEVLRRQKQIMRMLAAEHSGGIDEEEWRAAYERRYE